MHREVIMTFAKLDDTVRRVSNQTALDDGDRTRAISNLAAMTWCAAGRPFHLGVQSRLDRTR
jgi:hypothetical protein